MKPFNPLDKRNLGRSVSQQLLESRLNKLPPEPFIGSGIYAIYYHGEFPLYRNISGRDIPIYVGKAVPIGSRKGVIDESTISSDQSLYKRLKEHSESINEARNISLDDFFCKYLTVDDIWIPLGESILINEYKPIWNVYIDGFGNHDPGKGRYKQKKSFWDILHVGRKWADRLTGDSLDYDSVFKKIETIVNPK